MDRLAFMESFVAALDAGSMSAAARKRGVSQPALSQQINALETAYGRQFLLRTRNGVKPTEAGSILYERAQRLLSEHRALVDAVDGLSNVVRGRIKFTTNVGLSQYILGDVLVKLRAKHPQLSINLTASDNLVNLASEGYDIALRAGSTGQNKEFVRRIGALQTVHVATPDYLDKHLRPASPDDLQKLGFIQYKEDPDQTAVQLQNGTRTVKAPITTTFSAQLPDLVLQALQSGLGYAKAPLFMVHALIKQGVLEEVLPAWRPASKDLYLVFPTREERPLRMRIFIDALVEALASTEGINLTKSARQMAE